MKLMASLIAAMAMCTNSHAEEASLADPISSLKTEIPSTQLKSVKHLFILSGQSNMAHIDPDESFTPAVNPLFPFLERFFSVFSALGEKANS